MEGYGVVVGKGVCVLGSSSQLVEGFRCYDEGTVHLSPDRIGERNIGLILNFMKQFAGLVTLMPEEIKSRGVILEWIRLVWFLLLPALCYWLLATHILKTVPATSKQGCRKTEYSWQRVDS